MIIAVTPEVSLPGETRLVTALLDAGLDRLHIRKPGYTAGALCRYVDRLATRHRERLVLHTCHDIAAYLGIRRLHVPEARRLTMLPETMLPDSVYSTSVHSIEDFNSLEPSWSYALISPVFPSITKPGYGIGATVLGTLRRRQNRYVHMVALGGISVKGIALLKQEQVDGMALAGTLWQSAAPLTEWEKCRQAWNTVP